MKRISESHWPCRALAAGAASGTRPYRLPAAYARGFVAGLVHPLGGLDHLLAMIAVGIWSALVARERRESGSPRRSSWRPCSRARGLAHAGVTAALVETGIALSVVTARPA